MNKELNGIIFNNIEDTVEVLYCIFDNCTCTGLNMISDFIMNKLKYNTRDGFYSSHIVSYIRNKDNIKQLITCSLDKNLLTDLIEVVKKAFVISNNSDNSNIKFENYNIDSKCLELFNIITK